MKTKLILAGFFALTLPAIVLVPRLLLRHPALIANANTFEVHGQVLELDAAHKTVRLAHEAIPGYMPAMTMPLQVKDPALLTGLAKGDSVQFELVVTDDDSWISKIEKIPADDRTQPAAVTSGPTSDREVGRIHAGEKVPDFQLIDQDGKPVRLSEFSGKAVVLTFVYTRCPLPNFCPLMSKNFAELQQRLAREFGGRYALLSISIDPEFDRPEVLKEYAARYGANPEDWTFATGTPEQIQFVAGLMGLFYERENGLISHDLRTALISQDGHLLHLWKSNVWTPYEVQRLVRETLTGDKDVAAR